MPIISPYVRAGITVLEPGPGMGFFTLPLAELVGPSGRVIAIDVQPKMIDGLKRRAEKAGLLSRIECRVSPAQRMAIDDLAARVDFTLAFAMLHEFPDAARFFSEVWNASKPNAQLLLAEPRGHVDDRKFEAELAEAAKIGFRVQERPLISRSHGALLVKPA